MQTAGRQESAATLALPGSVSDPPQRSSEMARSFRRRLQAMVADLSAHCRNRNRNRDLDRDLDLDLDRDNRDNRDNRGNRGNRGNRFLFCMVLVSLSNAQTSMLIPILFRLFLFGRPLVRTVLPQRSPRTPRRNTFPI
ncbi:MAG TPA: hypothetical protein DEW46_03675 [Verrucomicrobia bacterium]|nr:hypothetical protein [Verrucomicrobiota bacterium]